LNVAILLDGLDGVLEVARSRRAHNPRNIITAGFGVAYSDTILERVDIVGVARKVTTNTV